jgi:hypothetical protein
MLNVPSRRSLCNGLFHGELLVLLHPLLHVCFPGFLNIKVDDALAAAP